MSELKIVFAYGMTISHDQMEDGRIYLDGACRGPAIDNQRKAYSFDHHANCLRFATLATCQQVMTALELGFDPSGLQVVLNGLDADSSLSLWLLRNPEKTQAPEVRTIVEHIGFVDAHGPVRPSVKLLSCLNRSPRIPQTIDMLWEDQNKIDMWFNGGDDALPKPFSFPPCPAFGLTQSGELLKFDTTDDFGTLYNAGCVVAVLIAEGPEGTKGYSIGKRSDFVSYDIARFMTEMNKLEPGWGGGSTIGGAPRLEGGLRSSLSVEVVKRVFVEVSR